MHTLIRIASAFILVVVTGVISGKWFALERGVPFAIGGTMFKNRHFWLGVGVGLMFLFSDYRFAHYMVLTQ